MYALLFSEEIVDRAALRIHAREEIYGSSLIRDCACGDLNSIKALLLGFWPFVQAFEQAIDERVGRLPTRPLVQRFGQDRVRVFFNEARKAVREMKEEEGSHAILWRRAAEELGVDLNEQHTIPGITTLLESACSDDEVEFFCWLAGTEYIAEELSAYLCNSPAFNKSFPSGKWVWGLAHLMHDHEGPSHLEIDEDLARAYHPSTDPSVVGTALFTHIRRCERLFGNAAADVGQILVPQAG